jgi:hypothetical protein
LKGKTYNKYTAILELKEEKNMKKQLIAVAILATLTLGACNTGETASETNLDTTTPTTDCTTTMSNAHDTSPSTDFSTTLATDIAITPEETDTTPPATNSSSTSAINSGEQHPGGGFNYEFEYFTFEQMLLFATDVVIAQYVGHKPFGRNAMEYEFVVLDRVLGNAPDRIFVYTSTINAGGNLDAFNRQSGFTNARYLLPVRAIADAITDTHDDGYTFIRSLVVDLDEPSRSTFMGEVLNPHSTGLDFNSRSLSRNTIVSYVREITRNNTLAPQIIRSERLEDIISGSPYVLVVEIGERLAGGGGVTEIYEVDVVRALKGGVEQGGEVFIEFPHGSVQPGERHIVAVRQLNEGYSDWFWFTSRNSLFGMERLDEVLRVINSSATS